MLSLVKKVSLFVSCAGLALCLTAPAGGNELEAKWRGKRTTANGLGDDARAGDRAALDTLKDLEAQGVGPAIHNLGWLHEVGSDALAWATDETRACDYYIKAAKTDYPPSLYKSGMCLYSGPLSGDGDEARRQESLGYLRRAADAGWTEAAMVLAEHYLDHIPVGQDAWKGYQRDRNKEKTFDARQAYYFIRLGLISKPGKSQKTNLQYFKGVLALKISSATGIVSFREGDLAFRDAAQRGHKDAAWARQRLQDNWLWEMGVAANRNRYAESARWQGKYESVQTIEARCFAPGAENPLSLRKDCHAFKTAEAAWYDRWRVDISYARLYFVKKEESPENGAGIEDTDEKLALLSQTFDAKIFAFEEKWRRFFTQ